MARAKRWDFEKHQYEEVDIPDKASAFQANMDTKVECAECGRKIAFGDGYTSRRIHTNLGLGYAVCKRCYNLERTDEQIAEQRQRSKQ